MRSTTQLSILDAEPAPRRRSNWGGKSRAKLQEDMARQPPGPPSTLNPCVHWATEQDPPACSIKPEEACDGYQSRKGCYLGAPIRICQTCGWPGGGPQPGSCGSCGSCGHHKGRKTFYEACPRLGELLFKGGTKSAKVLMQETSREACSGWVVRDTRCKDCQSAPTCRTHCPETALEGMGCVAVASTGGPIIGERRPRRP